MANKFAVCFTIPTTVTVMADTAEEAKALVLGRTGGTVVFDDEASAAATEKIEATDAFKTRLMTSMLAKTEPTTSLDEIVNEFQGDPLFEDSETAEAEIVKIVKSLRGVLLHKKGTTDYFISRDGKYQALRIASGHHNG